MKRMIQEAIARALAGIRLAYRAKLTARGEGAEVQLLQAEALAGETLQAAELFQHFGFSSAPPPGTQLIVLPLGGRTAHSVIIATEHGAYRLEVQSGEACLYSQWGDKVHVKQEEVEIATRRLVISAPESATLDGTLVVTGDVVAGGISLIHHQHTGCSGGLTGRPVR